MSNSDDLLSVWEVFKNKESNILYLVKCVGLKDALETSLQMRKEEFYLINMYSENQLIDMGILK